MNKLVKSLDKFGRYYSKEEPKKEIENFFILNALKQECYYKSVVVDFSPAQNLQFSLEDKEPTFPIFNHDKNHFTKAFILPKDKDYCRSKPKKLKDRFQQKLNRKKQYADDVEKPEIFLVEPDSKYCQICKNKYIKYYDHLKELFHQELTQMSQGQINIEQIIEYFNQLKEKQQTEDKRMRKYKTKRISKKNEQKTPKSKRNAKSIRSSQTTTSKSR